jgi:16S rRNA (uracil1498-N3)-methyltransferase
MIDPVAADGIGYPVAWRRRCPGHEGGPKGSKVRVFVDHPLGEGQTVRLDQAQSRYLFSGMRLGTGDTVHVFNGHEGEWHAEVAETGKRGGTLAVRWPVAGQRMPPDLWLMFAPLKKTRTDFVVEKAAELGAARIVPVITEFTNAERVRRDRLQAHAVEAVEQCGGTFVPEVAEAERLAAVLDAWPAERRVMFCDEALAGPGGALDGPAGAPWAILIGPEGGFADAERARLRAMPQAAAVGLGPRILRADTAAVAALALWQAALGDWR